MPIIATYHVEEIEFGQRVKLIKTKSSIHVEPDQNGNYKITGVFPDERQVFVEKIIDDQIELEVWDEAETTVRDIEWQESGPTQHDITEDGVNEMNLQSFDDREADFDENHEVSGLHLFMAYSLDFLPNETRVRLKSFKGYKLAIKDPNGDFIVTGSIRKRIRDTDGYEVVVISKEEHQRASDRKIGERYVTGRRSGECGDSRLDFVDKSTREEFFRIRKERREQKAKE